MSLIATTALVLGAAKGIANWWETNQKIDDQIDDYTKQKDKLTKNKESYKEESNLLRNNKLNEIADSISANDRALKNTQESQATNLATGSRVASENSKIMNIEYAELLNSVKQSSGTATTSAASSGFRMTASAMNTKKVAERAGTSAINKFKIQSDLQQFTSYEDVRSNYENAENQIEEYKQQKIILERNKKETNKLYDTKIKNYNEVADIDITYLGNQIDYLKDGGRKLANWSAGIGMASDMFNAYAPYYKE